MAEFSVDKVGNFPSSGVPHRWYARRFNGGDIQIRIADSAGNLIPLDYALQSRSISAGTGLSGGGDLSANRTISFDTAWGDARYQAAGDYAAAAHTHPASQITPGTFGAGTYTMNTLLVGGQITSSAAKLQVNGFTRMGAILLHEHTTPSDVNSALTTSSGPLRNESGDLTWQGERLFQLTDGNAVLALGKYIGKGGGSNDPRILFAANGSMLFNVETGDTYTFQQGGSSIASIDGIGISSQGGIRTALPNASALGPNYRLGGTFTGGGSSPTHRLRVQVDNVIYDIPAIFVQTIVV